MASLGCVVELALLCLVLQRAETLQLTISPQHAHLDEAGDRLTVTCQASEPITGCQFNFIKDERNWEGPLLDLSRGASSKINPLLLSDALIETNQVTTDYHRYKYSGAGLNSGQCGITLRLAGPKKWMLGCRVQAGRGGWKYAIMSFVADASSSVAVTATPQSIVAVPGLSASILCKADGPLQGCRIDTPGSQFGQLNLDEEDESSNSTDEHRYHGAGVDNGECGVTFPLVTEGLNGYAFCGVFTASGNSEHTGIPFVVARVPNRPVLTVGRTVAPGSPLEATCTVQGGRPVADITWYLGDEVVRRDDENDVTDLVWRWPTSLQKITQVLKRKLEATDDGKELRCEIGHVTLSRRLVAKKTIKLSRNSSGCLPLTSKTVLLSCSKQGVEENCGELQQVGTEALLTCKPGLTQPDNVSYRQIRCMEDNEWNHPLFDCNPDCGRRRFNDGTVLAFRGQESVLGEFPWHLNIYRKTSANRDPDQICSGSLISPNVVISTAHCFWNDQKQKTNPASEFKITAGQHSRLWEDADPSIQRRDVQRVVIHPLFRGQSNNYVADIAILRPESPFDMNLRVNPICVDWDNHLEQRQLVEGNTGVTAGWAFGKLGVQSDTLMYADLPFVTSETCFNSLPVVFTVLLTTDKFCAGFVNQSTSVCRGGSGAGLMFRDPSTDKYYLRGISSIGFPIGPIGDNLCYSQHYTGFIRVSQYISWIQETIKPWLASSARI